MSPDTPAAAAPRAVLEPGRGLGVEEAIRRAFLEGLEAPQGSRWKRRARHWKRILARLRPLGGISRGNAIEIFCDGDSLFEALWAEIAGARERVLLSTYTLADDRVGRRTLEELCNAAARGVRVRLRYDAVGSIGLDAAGLDDLRRLGGDVEVYNPAWRLRSRLVRRMTRDHRKVCVVDGHTAFCGGMNVSEDYAGERFGTSRFCDAHLRVRGPAAHDLELLFARPGDPVPERPGPEEQDVFVQVLESNRRKKRRAIQRALRLTISRCMTRAWLSSPYFVPPRRLRRALQGAARRGVDVRLITAGVSDVPIARAVGRHVYSRFLRSGVRIFEMRSRTLHAKTVAIDGVYASVGSFNLDLLSDRYNHEVNVSMLDRGLARSLEQDFEANLRGSVEVTLDTLARRGFFERAFGWALYQLSKLL